MVMLKIRVSKIDDYNILIFYRVYFSIINLVLYLFILTNNQIPHYNTICSIVKYYKVIIIIIIYIHRLPKQKYAKSQNNTCTIQTNSNNNDNCLFCFMVSKWNYQLCVGDIEYIGECIEEWVREC